MPRSYTITGNPASVASAANTELLQGLATSTGKFRLTRLEIGQITTQTLTGIVIQLNRYSAAFTAGSGGTAITPAKLDSGDAAAVSTWLQLNTTKISGGTQTVLRNHVMQDVVGMQEIPIPEDQAQFNASEALQVLLVTALGVTTNLAYIASITEL